MRKPTLPLADAAAETQELLASSGKLGYGFGLMSGAYALSVGLLALLAVIGFHFPQYLSTPELRQQYDVETLRIVLFVALVTSGGVALANVLMGRQRNLNLMAGLVVLVAVALGGSRVQIGAFPDHTPYIGLDWFILDLLGTTLVFAALERVAPYYKGQALFRAEWQTDLVHFVANHFLVGLMLLIVNFLIHGVFDRIIFTDVQQFVRHIPVVPQLLLCILVADLAQYATHRAYHEVPFLWRFHAVHHSVKTMDWLAGSRLHLCEVVFTRVCVLGPLYVLGFDKHVMDLYIIAVGFQATLNHANVDLPWGPLKYLIVTPDFHHWHHASDDEAIDKNYASHYAFLDYLFGTAVQSSKRYPERYGVVGDGVPLGFWRHQLYPFQREGGRPEPEQR